jgi:DNA repair protein RecO (recombination protein O)
MHWRDEAIVTHVRKYGEHGAIVTLFSKEYGIHKGMVRSVSSASSRGIYQCGNILLASWQGRLREHLGNFSAELHTPIAASLLSDPLRLSAMSSALSLLCGIFPEHDPHQGMYVQAKDLLLLLKTGASDWPYAYVMFEYALLTEAGFGLDLSECAATGSTEALCYVSPKSGRAVSREAGKPYQDKLLKLPEFLRTENAALFCSTELYDALQLTGYFLEKHWFSPHGGRLPEMRGRFVGAYREQISLTD